MPLLVAWPGTIPRQVHAQPAITLDLATTTLAAAGASSAGTEGVDLVPVLTGARWDDLGRALFWRVGDRNRAVCDGGRKLLRQGNGPCQLYDLEADPHEDRDHAGDRPDEVADLARRWDARNAGNSEPLWW